MNTVNTVTTPAYIPELQEEPGGNDPRSAIGARADGRLSPEQPLPGSSVSLKQLWRMIKENMQLLAAATAGSSKEAVASKKATIKAQTERRLADIHERMEKMQEEEKKSGWMNILGIAGVVLGVIAAAIVLPLSMGTAAVGILLLTASILVPMGVDSVLESLGVPEETRMWVQLGVTAAFLLVDAIMMMWPGMQAAAAAKIGAAVGKIAKVAKQGVSAMKTAGALSKVTSKIGRTASRVQRAFQRIASNVQTIGRVTGVMGATTQVAAGYLAYEVAGIQRDLADNKAEQEKMDAIAEKILMLLDEVTKSLERALASLAGVQSSEREFANKAISIHM